MPMPADPYAGPPGPQQATAVAPAPPPRLSLEQIEAMLAQGGYMGGTGMPSAGAINAAAQYARTPPPMPQAPPMEGQLPPQPPTAPPPPGMGAEAPPPPPGPPAQPPGMMAGMNPMLDDPMMGQLMGGQMPATPPVPQNLAVPGGASIMNGNPQAAPSAPVRPPDFKPTYNVTMATDPEAARMQYATEAQRGQNHSAKRNYEEMTRARKVQTMRGLFGTR